MADPQRDSDGDIAEWESRQNGSVRDEKGEGAASYMDEDDGQGMSFCELYCLSVGHVGGRSSLRAGCLL